MPQTVIFPTGLEHARNSWILIFDKKRKYTGYVENYSDPKIIIGQLLQRYWWAIVGRKIISGVHFNIK